MPIVQRHEGLPRRRGYACIVGSLQMQFVETLLLLGELAEPAPDRNVIRLYEAPGCRMKKAVTNAHMRIKCAASHSLLGLHRSHRVDVKKAIMNARMRIKCATSRSLLGLHRSRRVDVDRIACKFVKQSLFGSK
jgi:hypothetical protein